MYKGGSLVKKIIGLSSVFLLILLSFFSNTSSANSLNLGKARAISAEIYDYNDFKIKISWKNDELLNQYIYKNGNKDVFYQINLYVRNDDYVTLKNFNYKYNDVIIDEKGLASIIFNVGNLGLDCDYNDLSFTSYNFKIRYGLNLRDILGNYTYYGEYSPNISIGRIYPFNYASAWALEELNRALKYNLISERISSDMQVIISREEFCELAVLYYEKKLSTSVPYHSNPFIDVENVEVLKAYELGIVKGYPDKTFRPTHPITREDIAVMIERLLKLTNEKIVMNNKPIMIDEKVSDYALNSLISLYNEGIIKGNKGKLYPQSSTTRQEAVIMLLRCFEKF